MTINDYLSALRTGLKGHLPDSVAEDRLRELGTHLEMAAEDYRSAGFTNEESARRAMADMGAIPVVADKLVRQHRGYSLAPAKQLTRLVGPLVLVTMILPTLLFTLPGFHLPILSWVGNVSAVCAIVAVVAFGYRVYLTRRWIAAPVCAWVAAALTVLLIVPPIVHFGRRNDSPPLVARQFAQSQLEKMRPEIEAVAGWRQGKPPADEGLMANIQHFDHRYPLMPVPIGTETRIIPGLFPMGQPDAAKSWSLFGAQFADLVAQKQVLYGSMARGETPDEMNPWSLSLYLSRLPHIVEAFAIAAVQLFAWNAVILFFATWVDRTRNALHRRRVA